MTVPRTFTVSYTVDVWSPDSTKAAVTALQKLVHNKAMISRIITGAMYKTLLVAYRARFNMGMAFTKLQLGGRGKSAVSNRILLAKLEKLREEYDALMADKHINLARAKAAEIQKTQDAFTSKGAGGKSYADFVESLLYNSGAMRSAMDAGMQEILQLITGQGMITRFNTTPLQFGIGNIAGLDSVRTPSYSQVIKGGVGSRSKFHMLWRQIEFGTGALADKPFKRMTGSSKMSDGSWRYSSNSRSGVIIRGSEGMHVFKSAAGFAYNEDATRFFGVLAEKLTEALQGLEE